MSHIWLKIGGFKWEWILDRPYYEIPLIVLISKPVVSFFVFISFFPPF